MTHQVCKQDMRISRFSDTGTELEPVFLRDPFEIPQKRNLHNLAPRVENSQTQPKPHIQLSNRRLRCDPRVFPRPTDNN